MFDPLHKWLGIPPDEQPPHHYRLLGLTTFEDDREVIDAAADKQMSFLHNLSNGEHATAAEDLSNQISAARLCLLSAEKKRLYDDRLRAISGADSTSPQPSTTPTPIPTAADIAAPVVTPPSRLRRTPVRRKSSFSLSYWHYSAILCLVLLLLVLVALKRGLVSLDPERAAWLGIKVEQNLSPTDATEAPPKSVDTRRSDSMVMDETKSRLPVTQVPETALPEMSLPVTGSASLSPVAPTEPITPDPVAPSSPTTNDSLVDLMHPSVALPPERQDVSETGDDTLTKDPLPDGTLLADATALVRDLYKNKYSSARTSSEKIALADQMRSDGQLTNDDPVGRFALWRVSRDIYASEGQFRSALEIVDEIGKRYRDVDVAELKSETLTASANAVGSSDIATFVETTASVMQALADEENYAAADQLGSFVGERFASRLVRSKRAEFSDLQTQIKSDAAKHSVYLAALETLKQAPADPKANQTVGIYRCLVQQRWKDGLKYLALGPQSPVTTAAKLDTSATKDADAAIAVADAWYELAAVMPDPRSRDAVLRRALRWYAAAQGIVTGLVRKKVDLRVDELEGKYPERKIDDAVVMEDGGSGVAILDQRTRNGGDSRRDFASVNGKTLTVGMGALPSGAGQAEAGIELKGVKKMTVTGSASHAEMVTVDAYSKSGFVVDYHTAEGYVRRVFLGLGLEPAREFLPMPIWGKATVPDVVTDIGRSDSYTIDLTRWAPPDWDGQCWFALLMHNGGTDRKLEATLSW